MEHKPAVMMTLKESTMDLHKEIEQYMPVFRSDFDVSKYQDLLGKMYNFYSAFENNLKSSLDSQGVSEFYQDRFKTPRIEADLQSLDAKPLVKPVTDLPSIDSLPAIAGALYVIEGSSLGGQVISKHLHENLKLEPEQIRFFGGYGPQTGKRWQEFQKWMGTLDFNEEDTQVAVASARDTFRSMLNCLKN
ncbi:biliverdin-producing heme oxygenase [Bdellovibrio sp. SKB1291214]|uniref:biliverdin-producing heme oxygenase n=1 Tax=Bdellovibrio sp. SKB1291214 TaxID=1732569 RepID=UPI000B51C39C|nr:biliverdin-producing heme oxygenase [Bdellovibrio sp. SKB1291214]UYL09417.1 biliverdin-producing heme oxygenase [Bdellovibrio sp. SKB1291214]